MKKLFLILLFPVLLFAKAPNDSNFVYLIFKVGDAANGIKHGQPICYIDPLHYSVDDYGKTISHNMKRVFFCTKVNKNKMAYINGLFENGEPKKNKVKWTKIKQDKNLPYDLEERLLSQDTVEIIDITEEIETFIEPLTGNEVPVIDANAISAGTYTVGTGGDYATWAIAAADVSVFTGNLTLNQISNTTEAATIVFDVDMFNYTFNCNGNNYDLSTSGTIHTFRIRNEGTNEILFHKFNFIRTSAPATQDYALLLTDGIVGTYKLCVYNNVFNGGGFIGNAIRLLDDSPTALIYNNLIHNVSGDAFSIGLRTDAINSNSIIENNTLYNNGVGLDAKTFDATYLNNAAFDNTTDFANIGSATGNNNASSDATAANGNWSSGSGNQTSLVAATEFESLINTDSNFLWPTKSSNLDGTGTNPTITGHTTYYNGFTIISNNVDIGANGIERVLARTTIFKNPIYNKDTYKNLIFKNGVFK